MSLLSDLEHVVTTVLSTDPSFNKVTREVLDQHIADTRLDALADAKDDFLMSLMRLLALPGNGHTRLIPNNAISVLPLRFVAIGSHVNLVGSAPGLGAVLGAQLIAVNGVCLKDIEARAAGYLAGTGQRKRVVGPILFAWPNALKRLGVCKEVGLVEYELRADTGQTTCLRMHTEDTVSGSIWYPRNEHGKSDAAWVPTEFLKVRDFLEDGLVLAFPSFFDLSEKNLPDAICSAAEQVRSCASTPLLVDVRGNTGGDFLKTMPLIDAISEGATDRNVGLLVDKFTFSAAIVFVAIIKFRLGARCQIIGEEMGDGLRFYAEGGLLELPASGASVRYSTAYHDWATGRTDETTPAEIAEQIVPVGTLKLDRSWIAGALNADPEDGVYRDILRGVNI